MTESKMKIIIVDQMTRFQERQIRLLDKHGDVVFTPLKKDVLAKLPTKITRDETLLVPDPDVFDWKIPNNTLTNLKKLKAICLPTTSYEMLDLEYCKHKNILVTTTPDYSTEAVAEYAIWMLLSLVRKLPLMAAGKIHPSSEQSIQEETRGKVMGIIGLGKIGRRIAEYGYRMGMKVIYWSRSRKDTFFERWSIENVLKHADYLFPCYSINEETENLLNTELLQLVKKSAYFISINRKDGFHVRFLEKRVRQKKLAGLAYEADNAEKLAKTVNIFTPPPVAWYTKEARETCYETLTETIVSVICGNPQNAIYT